MKDLEMRKWCCPKRSFKDIFEDCLAEITELISCCTHFGLSWKQKNRMRMTTLALWSAVACTVAWKEQKAEDMKSVLTETWLQIQWSLMYREKKKHTEQPPSFLTFFALMFFVNTSMVRMSGSWSPRGIPYVVLCWAVTGENKQGIERCATSHARFASYSHRHLKKTQSSNIAYFKTYSSN